MIENYNTYKEFYLEELEYRENMFAKVPLLQDLMTEYFDMDNLNE